MSRLNKRLFSSLICLFAACLLTTSAVADELGDVTGTDYETAVEELVALGVLSGYPDGTFRPNNTISRAEFAKIIVVATGNESSVSLFSGMPSQFSDVASNDWFNGYVNVAAAKGLIKGDPSGTFRPQDEISYAEVLTVLVRSLGYQDDKLTGNWPFSHVMKAQEEGLLDNVSLTSHIDAPTRGSVAILSSNTVNSPTVTYDTDGNEVEGDLLISKIGTSEEYIITSPDINDSNEVELSGERVELDSNYIVAGGETIEDLLGNMVTAVKVDGKVKVIADTANEITNGTLSRDYLANETEVLVKVDGEEKSYSVDEDVIIYYNYDKKNMNNIGSILSNAEVEIFLNDEDEVRFIIALAFQYEDALLRRFIEANEYRDARIDILTIKQKSQTLTVADDAHIYRNGEQIELLDLSIDDVLTIAMNDENQAVIIDAYSDTFTGEVTRIVAENEIDIDGVKYEFLTSRVGDVQVDDEYEVHLNKNGKIVKMVALAKPDTIIGLVTEIKEDRLISFDGEFVVSDHITILTNNGKRSYYVHEDYSSGSSELFGDQGTIAKEHDVISVVLEDGIVVKQSRLGDTTKKLEGTTYNPAQTANVNHLDGQITVDGQTYYMKDSSLFYKFVNGQYHLDIQQALPEEIKVKAFRSDGIDITYVLFEVDEEEEQIPHTQAVSIDRIAPKITSASINGLPVEIIDGNQGVFYLNETLRNGSITLDETATFQVTRVEGINLSDYEDLSFTKVIYASTETTIEVIDFLSDLDKNLEGITIPTLQALDAENDGIIIMGTITDSSGNVTNIFLKILIG